MTVREIPGERFAELSFDMLCSAVVGRKVILVNPKSPFTNFWGVAENQALVQALHHQEGFIVEVDPYAMWDEALARPWGWGVNIELCTPLTVLGSTRRFHRERLERLVVLDDAPPEAP